MCLCCLKLMRLIVAVQTLNQVRECPIVNKKQNKLLNKQFKNVYMCTVEGTATTNDNMLENPHLF